MKQLSLLGQLEPLDLNPPLLTSFYGGGGKTTLMRALAEELSNAGLKALLTTTTKIFPYPDLVHFYSDKPVKLKAELLNHLISSNLAVFGRPIEQSGKIDGITTEEAETLFKALQVSLLVEGDGSKGLPIKGYNAYEPVLPAASNLIVPVIGANALECPVEESYVHRSATYKMQLGLDDKKKQIIDEDLIAKTYAYMANVGQKQAAEAKTLYVLNKYDCLKDPVRAIEIARAMGRYNLLGTLLVTEARMGNPVKMVLGVRKNQEPVKVAAVILAAGTSRRMGRDKLALPFKDSTVLEETIRQVRGANLDQIILVVQPDSKWKQLAERQEIKIVENPGYLSGQAGSLIKGLEAVSAEIQGVLFTLADQPLITSPVYNQLLSSYRLNLKNVTYPLYQGKRGNPVLFDRVRWPELLCLAGDRGGRELLAEIEPNQHDQVDLSNREILIDLDTEADYKKYLS